MAPLSGREKATIFLSILGSEVASRVLRYLPEELADIIAAGINHLPTPSPDALAEVLEEYQSFLALPEPQPVSYVPPAVSQKKNFGQLIYERPQVIAFLFSLLSPEEKMEALNSLPREKSLIEELLGSLKINPLRPKLEEKMKEIFMGRIF